MITFILFHVYIICVCFILDVHFNRPQEPEMLLGNCFKQHRICRTLLRWYLIGRIAQNSRHLCYANAYRACYSIVLENKDSSIDKHPRQSDRKLLCYLANKDSAMGKILDKVTENYCASQ